MILTAGDNARAGRESTPCFGYHAGSLIPHAI
jgi:hypothetical protein